MLLINSVRDLLCFVEIMRYRMGGRATVRLDLRGMALCVRIYAQQMHTIRSISATVTQGLLAREKTVYPVLLLSIMIALIQTLRRLVRSANANKVSMPPMESVLP